MADDSITRQPTPSNWVSPRAPLLLRGERVLYGPAKLKARMDQCSIYTDRLRPLGERFFFSIKHKVPVVTSIVGLLFSRGPLAIAKLVISVIIQAFYGIIFTGPLSHIMKKGREDEPRSAYGDSSAAVSIKAGGLIVCASLDHREPAPVSRRARFSMLCMPMLCGCLSLEAAATSMVTGKKVAASGYTLHSAVAKAVPFWPSVTLGSTDYGQSVKLSACQVDKRWHVYSSSMKDNIIQVYYIG